MLDYSSTRRRKTAAYIAGALALPLGIPAAVSALSASHGGKHNPSKMDDSPAAAALPTAPPTEESTGASHEDAIIQSTSSPSEPCLAQTLCTLKSHLRGTRAGWRLEQCRAIAHAVLASAQRHRLHPALLLAVMINESSLDENAVAITQKGEGLQAKDSGLMGIRCIADVHGKCRNGRLRGRSWASVMDPTNNIELGARELEGWRAGGGLERVVTRQRDENGEIQETRKLVPCRHKTHAYWAHYNHGPIYIDKGYARHYPHRVAVLYYALARALRIDAPELQRRTLTMHDPGTRQRTADHPVEPRFRELCQLIAQSAGSCGEILSLRPSLSRAN